MRLSPVFVALVCLPLLLAGCTPSENGGMHVRSNGALAISADDRLLYAADADNDELVVIDVASLADLSRPGVEVLGRIPVGRGPERVAVGADGLVYVTNRFDRSVSVVDPVSLTERSRIEVGVEPVGLAFTPDGGTLLVANSMSHTVSVIDVESGDVVKTLPTSGEPSGVAVVGPDKAYVTHFRTGEVSTLNLSALSLGTRRLAMTVSPEKTGFDFRIPGQPRDPIVSPIDERVFIPHVQAKDSPVPTDVEGGYAGFGMLPVVADAVATVDADRDELFDAPGIGFGFRCLDVGCGAFPGDGRRDVPALITTSHGFPLSGATAGVIDAQGRWLFLVNLHSRNVLLLSARGEGVYGSPVRVGRGPRGIALSRDGNRAFVYNAFSHSVSVLDGRDGGVSVSVEKVVGTSPLTPEQQLGRDLFFAADDPRMTDTAGGGIACASCHPNGRDDGLTWQFNEGPRNTPTLAGVSLLSTGPWHWDGLLSRVHDMKDVVEQRMGGTGTRRDFGERAPLGEEDFRAMFAFLDSLPGYDNPHRDSAPLPMVEAGRALFEGKANCAQCHSGPQLTDNALHASSKLGTLLLQNERGSPSRFPAGVNTPSLRHLFATAPYLHHGLAGDLRAEAVLTHGGEVDLSASEVDQLIAYLKTL